MSMTINQPSVIDGFTVSRSIQIAAPIAKVWAAITEPQHLAQWFPQQAELEPVTVGASGAFTFEGYGTFPVVVESVEPLRSISYRWGNDNATAIPLDAARSTVFTFTLEAIETGTALTVVETGFETLSDPQASLEGNRGGWNHELDQLVAYLEGPR
jgi:uncharacterized protein YndB with AHSA1/START domain